MTWKQLPLLLLSLFLFTGCTAINPDAPPAQNIDWSQESPESIKAKISSSAGELTILSAFFSLSMNPPPEKMMSSLSGVITIDSRGLTPKIRIQAFHLFGSTLFDMVQGDRVQIYVPRQKTMYIEEETGGGKTEKDPRGPQAIFANMMLDPGSLILAPNQPLQIGADVVTLFLQDGWLNLDTKTGLIVSRHRDDMDIFYSAYTTVASTTVLPTRIRIETTDGSYKATCKLSKLSTPHDLPDQFFELSDYKPDHIKPLGELN